MNLEKIARWIVGNQIRRPLLFLAAFAVITLLLVPGIFQLVSHVEPSLEKVLPQDIRQVRTMNEMRTQFGADMMYLLVYADPPVTDIRNPQFLSYVDSLGQKIRTREHVEDVQSVVDRIRLQHQNIPGSLAQTEDILARDPFAAQFISEDYSFTVIRVRSDTGASAELVTKVIEGIEADIASLEPVNPGARVQITGFNAIDKATFEVIMSDFLRITIISMLLVGIVVFATFRSLRKGMLPMVVVMTALLWTMGIVGYLGLTITVVSMVAAAMIMGLGIDFGIHVVHSYYHLRQEGKGSKSAMKDTMQELLRAMMGASFTTISGFLALLFGILPAMKNLGIILAIGIFTTLLGAVFLLPVIVVLTDRQKTTVR
ncbi:MAG: efflux RND transporter permease subunit [Nanoarchaeota archaeon]